jgi:hypothetical protein
MKNKELDNLEKAVNKNKLRDKGTSIDTVINTLQSKGINVKYIYK